MTHQTRPPAIEITGLRKAFGDKTVLDGIDLTIPEGTVFALLGPNGAGKTTTVQILSTLIPASGGQAVVAGHDVQAEPDPVRSAIGVTGQFSAVDKLLTGRENMLLMADLCHLGRAEGRERATRLLEEFELTEAAGQPAATYSGGMQRRLDIAMTLMIRPPPTSPAPFILFLDEPTAGLDPRGRRRMWQIVRDLVADGVTIFLTTQYLEEADELADRIAVLDRGHIVAEGTPGELKRLVPGSHIRLEFPTAAERDAAASALPDASPEAPAAPDGESFPLRIASDGSVGSLRAVLDRLDARSIEVSALTVHTPDLDDAFLALTGTPVSDPS
ncbi:MAG: ATP-binding cassette domain-containing protein [Streptosporangiaceae bacterium]